MDAAVGQQPHEMQGGTLPACRLERADEDLVMTQRPIGASTVDAGELLMDDAPGADVEVADLGVAHLARGKAHRLARRLQADRRMLRERGIEMRRLGQRDRIARTGLGQAEPVHDDERRGKMQALPRGVIGFDHYRHAFTRSMKDDALRLAPPTRPPSMSGCASSDSTFPTFIEPP